MTITDVRVRKIASEGKMKAIVSLLYSEAFVYLLCCILVS